MATPFTLMLPTLLLTFVAALPGMRQDPAPPQPPTPAEAVAQLKEAAKAKDSTELEAAIAAVGRIADKEVVSEVAKSLKAKETAVALAAINALRWNPAPQALDALLKAAKDRKLMAEPELAIALTYALGQKADPKAIKVLKDGLNDKISNKGKLIDAKVLALGRIRDKEAIEAILDYVNGGVRRRSERRMPTNALIALQVLTGQDPGKQVSDWMDWWYDEKSSLKVSAEEWPLPDGRAQRQWDRLWQDPETRSRESARGRDGESRGGTSEDSDEDSGPPQREKGPSEGRGSLSAT